MTVAPIATLGEALFDVTERGDDEPLLARPGGSPYNVALGLARLGRSAAFVGRLSRDPWGTLLRSHAIRSGVDLRYCVTADEPTTIALVELIDGIANYTFGVAGTADFAWSDAELAALPDTFAALHFGSLASWTEPAAGRIASRVGELRRGGVLISYDPNIRPQLQPDPAMARADVAAALPLAHLVKTSEEDLAWLYPGTPPGEIAGRWLAAGPAVVVITHGSSGASAYTPGGALRRPSPAVRVVDTVGAGDAFTSGLLATLAERGQLSPTALARVDLDGLAAALDCAALVAATTCTRAGANPPRRAELAESLGP